MEVLSLKEEKVFLYTMCIENTMPSFTQNFLVRFDLGLSKLWVSIAYIRNMKSFLPTPTQLHHIIVCFFSDVGAACVKTYVLDVLPSADRFVRLLNSSHRLSWILCSERFCVFGASQLVKKLHLILGFSCFQQRTLLARITL